MSRYRHVNKEIGRLWPCSVIMEIGTWNGRRAQELARAALRRNRTVHYYGFDLFESLSDADLTTELSKRPPARAAVEAELTKFAGWARRTRRWLFRRHFSFDLYAGYTKSTLPAFCVAEGRPRADFVFIDGGHSVATIDNDWRYCSQLVRRGGVILLDDYYDDPVVSRQFGCKSLVERLAGDRAWRVSILPRGDYVPDIGWIRIVKVEAAGP